METPGRTNVAKACMSGTCSTWGTLLSSQYHGSTPELQRTRAPPFKDERRVGRGQRDESTEGHSALSSGTADWEHCPLEMCAPPQLPQTVPRGFCWCASMQPPPAPAKMQCQSCSMPNFIPSRQHAVNPLAGSKSHGPHSALSPLSLAHLTPGAVPRSPAGPDPVPQVPQFLHCGRDIRSSSPPCLTLELTEHVSLS